MSKKAVLAGVLLALGTGVSLHTTIWLSRQPGVPERWSQPVLLFIASFLLAVAAGLVRQREPSRKPSDAGAPLDRRFRGGRVAAAVLMIGFFGWTLYLQTLYEPPLTALLTWLAAMVAAVVAFPGVARRGPGVRRPVSPAQAVALGGLLILAAAARLVRLDLVPPVFAGDEATVALDGKAVIEGRWRSDPFGTGSNSSMHLGMMPAGAGTILFESKLAGPRRMSAVIGTLAVGATAAVAGLLAGPWAALCGVALIAFSPHHVHFSRTSDNVVLDSLLVTAGVFFLLAALRTGSSRQGCLAGVFSGLALYGYGGGKVMPVVLLAALPLVLWRFRAARGRPTLLAAAMLGGFIVAGGPNLHYASSHFNEWNGRFHETSIFEPKWNRIETERIGSEAKLILNQVRLGTIGLLSSPPTIVIFTGFPMIAPAALTALGIVGLGWLYGRRRFAEATILALVIAGNLAGVSLTLSTPQPQRASSLVPMLAILGGIAVASFLALLPERAKGVPWRSGTGALLVGAFLARQVSGFPLEWIQYAESGGGHAALAQSVAQFVAVPRYEKMDIYFHGAPYVYWSFPSLPYFLPGRKAVDVLEDSPSSFPPGLHVCSEEYLVKGKDWAKALGLQRGVRLPHPAYPWRDVGFAFVVPPTETPPADAAR